MTLKKKSTTQSQKRDHVPALNPARLIVTLQQLEALGIPAEAKQAVSQILKAAANPRAESAETVIATMQEDQQQMIRESMPQYAQVFASSLARGRAELASISEDEWNQAVRNSNDE